MLGLITTRIDLPKDHFSVLNNAANYFLQPSQDLWGGRVVTVVYSNGQVVCDPKKVDAQLYNWFFVALKICIILLATPVGVLFRVATLSNADVQQALAAPAASPLSTSRTSVQASSIVQPEVIIDVHLLKSVTQPTPNKPNETSSSAKQEVISLPISENKTEEAPSIKLQILEKYLKYKGIQYFRCLHLAYNMGRDDITFIKTLADPASISQLGSDAETTKCWDYHTTQIINFEWEVLTASKEESISLLKDPNFLRFFLILQFAALFKERMSLIDFNKLDPMDFLKQLTSVEVIKSMIAENETLFKQKMIGVFKHQYEALGQPNLEESVFLLGVKEILPQINKTYIISDLGLTSHKQLNANRVYFMYSNSLAEQSPLDKFIQFKKSGAQSKEPTPLLIVIPDLPPSSIVPGSNKNNGSSPEKHIFPEELKNLKQLDYFKKLLELNNQEQYKPFMKRLQSPILMLEFFNDSSLDQTMLNMLKHHYQQCVWYAWDLVMKPPASLSPEMEVSDFFTLLCWNTVDEIRSLKSSDTSITKAQTTFQQLITELEKPHFTGKLTEEEKKKDESGFLWEVYNTPQDEKERFISNNIDQFIRVMFEFGIVLAYTKAAPEYIQETVYGGVLKKLKKANLEVFCPKEENWPLVLNRFQKVREFVAPQRVKFIAKNVPNLEISIVPTKL